MRDLLKKGVILLAVLANTRLGVGADGGPALEVSFEPFRDQIILGEPLNGKFTFRVREMKSQGSPAWISFYDVYLARIPGPGEKAEVPVPALVSRLCFPVTFKGFTPTVANDDPAWEDAPQPGVLRGSLPGESAGAEEFSDYLFSEPGRYRVQIEAMGVRSIPVDVEVKCPAGTTKAEWDALPKRAYVRIGFAQGLKPVELLKSDGRQLWLDYLRALSEFMQGHPDSVYAQWVAPGLERFLRDASVDGGIPEDIVEPLATACQNARTKAEGSMPEVSAEAKRTMARVSELIGRDVIRVPLFVRSGSEKTVKIAWAASGSGPDYLDEKEKTWLRVYLRNETVVPTDKFIDLRLLRKQAYTLTIRSLDGTKTLARKEISVGEKGGPEGEAPLTIDLRD